MKNTGINFENKVLNSKEFNIFNYRNFYNGGGCAIGDLNNDGLADVYFTANQGSNKLYLNKGNFKFDDITNLAGVSDSTDWSTGVVMVDINHDGWLDIYVCNAGYINGKAPQSKLYINNHNLTFTDKAAEYGLTNTGGYATHAAFFDYDKDGDLDCFIINNSFIPTNTLNYENKRNLRAKDWPVKDFLKGGGDRFLKNENGKFVDISEQAGIYGSLISFGLGVTVGDINNDGWLDVYVSNDFFERDYVYINQKNGSFKDEYNEYIQHSSHSSMGADMCDVNNDGYTDIFTTEMLPLDDYRLKTTASFENIDVNKLKVKSGFGNQYMQNTLQMNDGNGKFLETAYYSNVAASDWSWGGLIFDANNDAYPDIYVCNGIYKDVTNQDFIDFFASEIYQKMALSGEKTQIDEIISKMPSVPIPNKMFTNNKNQTFTDVAKDWGLETPSFSNGAAYGDLDNDGDLDLIVNNVNQNCFIYKNNQKEINNDIHSISFLLKDSTENTFAIGSKIKVFTNNQILTRELIPTRGFQSSVDYKIVIGLGASSVVDSLQIIWPDNNFQTIINATVDTLYTINNKHSNNKYNYNSNYTKPLFQLADSSFTKHFEDDYNDFYTERNIPEMLSHEGPKAAVADVNLDGLDDVFICGASLHEGQLYLQNTNGKFILKQTPIFTTDSKYEDVAAVFVDIDNDGDQDLIVGSGGNNNPKNSDIFNTRIYENDGKGNFIASNKTMPSTGNNTAEFAVYDFDNDGDQDIFVASKSVPGVFGDIPESALLENDGKGNFKNDSKTKFSNLNKIGMLSNAIWVNIFSNSKKDLVVLGEWMSPKIFSYDGHKFIEKKTNLQELNGLWQSIASNDLDGDGDEDLVLGNIGNNFYLKPSVNGNLKLWLADFDGNGTLDKIITKEINGKDMPVITRKDLTEQMPSLKKKNLKNEAYANQSINDLFSKEILEKAKVQYFNYGASVVAINNGNGNFLIKDFPWQAQLSCSNAISINDINNDNKPDILIGCNKYDLLPQFGRLDASFGYTLFNDGKNNFTYATNRVTGFMLNGCVRDIKKIIVNKQPTYLWLRNNELPLLFRKNI